MNLRIMRLEEVKQITGLSKTSIYRLEKSGDFPTRVKIGKRSVGWFQNEIEDFLRSLCVPKSNN